MSNKMLLHIPELNSYSPDSTLHIGWNQNQYNSFYLQLFNASCKNIFNKQLYPDVESKLLSIDLPTLETGNYFVRMTSRDTGKFFSSKLTIK